MGIEDDLEDKYSDSANGEALFFKNAAGTSAFRVELIDEGWEFSDGKYIGKGGPIGFPRDHRPRS